MFLRGIKDYYFFGLTAMFICCAALASFPTEVFFSLQPSPAFALYTSFIKTILTPVQEAGFLSAGGRLFWPF